MQNNWFSAIDDVHLWMIDQHLGRRSVSDFQRGVLALRKKDILTARVQPTSGEPSASVSAPVPAHLKPEPVPSRDAIAKAARISSNINQIEKIQKSAAPELVAAVKSGTISINAAATVASLPVEVQVAAVAGGKKELQQAARQVRETRAVARTEPESPGGVIARLRQAIAELSAENAALRAKLLSWLPDLAGPEILGDLNAGVASQVLCRFKGFLADGATRDGPPTLRPSAKYGGQPAENLPGRPDEQRAENE